MGLVVADNLRDVIGNMTLVSYDFNYGNEAILYLMDSEGNEERVRISAALRDLLEDFTYIRQEKLKLGKVA